MLDKSCDIYDIPHLIDDGSTASLTIKHVSEMNVNLLEQIPKTITNICLEGSIPSLVVPSHIEILDCCNMNLCDLVLNENICVLFACNNNLTKLALPPKIRSVSITNNKLQKLSIINDKELEELHYLDISDNDMNDLNIRLPKTMSIFNMSGNPNLRIKHLDFIFRSDELESLIDGDFWDNLGNGALYCEHVRHKLANRIYQGRKYINVKQLEYGNFFT